MAKKTPAQTTWNQSNLWNLASAYAALNPGWSPPGVTPTPSADAIASASPVYAPQIAAANTGLADTYTNLGVSFDANGAPVYGGGAYLAGAQNFGIDENQNQIGQGDVRYNPFSQANLMKQAFEQRKNATTNSYAANGQLYSGAVESARTNDATNYTQSNDKLVRGAKSYYDDLVSKARGAKDNNTLATAGLTGNALNDYLNTHANDPAPVLQANLGGKPRTPAQKTWTKSNLGRLASRYSAKNPGWKPPSGSL